MIEQYGGADGELAAALRYMNQRYTIPDKVIGLLTDVAMEEFSHLEMIATMVFKLTKDATPEMIQEVGLEPHYVNYGSALYYENAAAFPSTLLLLLAKAIRSRIYMRISRRKRKSRATYQYIIDLSDDPDLNDGLKFLREREIVHGQRFREAVEMLKENQSTRKSF